MRRRRKKIGKYRPKCGAEKINSRRLRLLEQARRDEEIFNQV